MYVFSSMGEHTREVNALKFAAYSWLVHLAPLVGAGASVLIGWGSAIWLPGEPRGFRVVRSGSYPGGSPPALGPLWFWAGEGVVIIAGSPHQLGSTWIWLEWWWRSAVWSPLSPEEEPWRHWSWSCLERAALRRTGMPSWARMSPTAPWLPTRKIQRKTPWRRRRLWWELASLWSMTAWIPIGGLRAKQWSSWWSLRMTAKAW